MNGEPVILALGTVDHEGVHGTSGCLRTWEELGGASPGDRRTYRAVFDRRDPTFRRLDGQTRAIVLAVEAAGIDDVLTPEERDGAALITETSRGSIEIDLRYTRSLERDVVEAAIFPYTLQSTCLGDVALRHGLRGPTVSLSIEEGCAGEALRETRRFFDTGVLRHAVVGLTDVQTEPLSSAGVTARAVIAVVAAPGIADDRAVAPWPALEEDPWSTLAAASYRKATAAGE